MTGNTPITRPRAMMLAILLLAVGLAGCTGGDTPTKEARQCAPDGEPIEVPYGSYDEARSAPGQVFEANNTDSPVQLKLLDPTDASQISTGSLPVIVLLFDSQADQPVTDASFLIETKMPGMGHGTSPEVDPTHEGDGIYVGCTTISMSGDWLINLDPQLADGTVLEYDVEAGATK